MSLKRIKVSVIIWVKEKDFPFQDDERLAGLLETRVLKNLTSPRHFENKTMQIAQVSARILGGGQS